MTLNRTMIFWKSWRSGGKKTRVDQKLPICFPKKFFIGKKSTISDGLVQSALLAGGIWKIMGNLGVPPRAQKVTDIQIFCLPK